MFQFFEFWIWIMYSSNSWKWIFYIIWFPKKKKYFSKIILSYVSQPEEIKYMFSENIIFREQHYK